MRFRLFKAGNPFKLIKSRQRFAWFPKRLRNGTIVWLEPYSRLNNYNGYGKKIMVNTPPCFECHNRYGHKAMCSHHHERVVC